MILEGEITVTHEGHYSKSLKPFEVDTFSGDWTTRALGTCIDFNVMTIGSIQSELYHLELPANSYFKLKCKQPCKSLFLYPTSRNLNVEIKDEKHQIGSGHLFLVEELSTASLLLHSEGICNIVVVEIY